MSVAVKPVWLVTYEGAEVSDELSPMIVSCEYTDELKDKSDALELTLEDRQGRWRSGWWPSKGDRIEVAMGLEGAPLLDCGAFQVETTKLSGPPDTVAVSALATARVQPLRTKQSKAFEDLTLKELVDQVAREFDFEVVGNVATVRLQRVTQAQETTLAFMRRLANDYGYAFSIRDARLIFYELAALEAEPSVAEFQRGALKSYEFEGSAQDTYAACELTYLDPVTKQLETVTVYEPHARQRVLIADATPAEARTLPDRTLRIGDRGEDVKWWQSYLQERGHAPGPIDGIFGPLTRAATMAFQRGAAIREDGIAGPETYRAAVERGYQALDAAPVTRTEVAGDVLRIERRVESKEQAELQARAALAEANRLQLTGSFSVPGTVQLVAGVTVDLADMARASGKYLVQRSKHSVSRNGGYTTRAEVTRV